MKNFKEIQGTIKNFLGVKEENFFSPLDWIKNFPEVKFVEGANFAFSIKVERLKEILESPCPFIEGKKVKDTFFLFCTPSQINGESLSILKWIEMFSHGKGISFHEGEKKKFSDEGMKKHGEAPVSSWSLLYKGIVPGSGKKEMWEQFKIVPEGYYVPILMEVIPMYFLSFLKAKNTNVKEFSESFSHNKKVIYGRTFDELDPCYNNGDHFGVGFQGWGTFGTFEYFDYVSEDLLGVFVGKNL